MALFPVRKTVTKKQAIASLMTILLGCSMTLTVFATKRVYAGTFQSAKLTISDSRSALTDVTYDLAMTAQASTAIKQVGILFCTAPTGACTPPAGLDVGTNPALASDNITGTTRTTTREAANEIKVVVGTPATQNPLAITMSFTGITNPSTANTSSYVRVTTYSDTGSTVIDQANMGFAVLSTDSLAVSAQVGSTFTFAVAAANTGVVNGESITVTDSTDTSIPFGVLVRDTPKVAAHDVSVTTNSNSGYTVTVKALTDPPLQDGTNNIDSFTGTNDTPTTWSSPDGETKNVNTGFFGYTTNDATLGTGTAARFTTSGPKWAGFSTTPLEVAYSAVAVSTAEVTRVGWKTEINGLQPAGDYSGTVVLVATPTY